MFFNSKAIRIKLTTTPTRPKPRCLSCSVRPTKRQLSRRSIEEPNTVLKLHEPPHIDVTESVIAERLTRSSCQVEYSACSVLVRAEAHGLYRFAVFFTRAR